MVVSVGGSCKNCLFREDVLALKSCKSVPRLTFTKIEHVRLQPILKFLLQFYLILLKVMFEKRFKFFKSIFIYLKTFYARFQGIILGLVAYVDNCPWTTIVHGQLSTH